MKTIPIKNLIARLFAFVVVVSMNGYTQDFPEYLRFRRYSMEQGLSQSTVNLILQDRLGFIWLATQDGLNRFDGYQFFVYKYHPADTLTLPNNFVYGLAEDFQRECLWIATHGGGLAKLDYRTGRIERYPNRLGDRRGLLDNYLYSILCDRNGRIWICTREQGVAVFDPEGKVFKHYRAESVKPGTLTHNLARTVYEDRRGQIWIGLENGLMRYDPANDGFILVHPTTAPVQSIIEDHQGRIWFGTDGTGLFCLNPRSQSIRQFLNNPANPYSLSNNHVRILYEDRDLQLWIGTGYGLNRLDQREKEFGTHPKFYTYLADPTDPYSLSNNLIQSLMEDSFRNLWVGTNGGGLNQFSKSTLHFRLYTNASLRLKEGNIDDVLSIAEDDNGWLWIGTWGEGMLVMDRRQNRIRAFRHQHGQRQSLPENSVFAFLPDSGNVMWIATYRGLSRVRYGEDIFQGKADFRHYPADANRPGFLTHPRLRCLMRSRDGKIWIGTYGGGINILDPATGRFSVIRREDQQSGGISNNNIWVLHEDHTGDIWVGTYGGGLNSYSSATGQWKNYMHRPYEPHSLSNDVVLAIHSDSTHVWVGTRVGLNVMDRQTERFRYYTVAQGLPNDVVYGILPDKQGRLWISTNQGISCITWLNDTTPVFTNYDRNSGLQGDEFNIGAYAISKTGEFFFGGIHGFNSFFPETVRFQSDPAPVRITAFKKFDRFYYTAPAITDSMPIELNYRENYFSFEFTALDFTDPAKNRYAYQLKGFDEDWVFCGQRRYATYTNLGGGTYTFLVRGAGHNGIWNPQPAVVRLTIIPPIWQTSWFRVTAGLFLIAAILGVIQFRTRSIKNQRRLLADQVRERTAELNDKNKRLMTALEEIRHQKDSLDAVNRQLTETLEALKQSQNQLIVSEKMAVLGHLVAGIAHEINNPLSFIDGNLNYLGDYLQSAIRIIEETEKILRLSPPHDPADALKVLEELKKGFDFSFILQDAEKTIEACRHGTQRIKKIVQDLQHLSLSHEEHKIRLDINECLNQAIQSLKHACPATIRIHRELGDIPVIQGYPVLLTQAFRHILLNAVQAISGEGQVSVISRIETAENAESETGSSQQIRVSITDNGIGIEAEHLSKIFDPFFTTKDPGQGTGLGLTMAYHVIRRHYGTIDVQSQRFKGTEVHILFPVPGSDSATNQ